jgi:hypothetical protein
MSNHRVITWVGASIFLLLALANLYRMLVGTRITIGGMEVGQTASFFALAIFAALSLMLFKAGGRERS